MYKIKLANRDSVFYTDDNETKEYLFSIGGELMTTEEIDRHENPEKYLSDEEKILIYRKNMPTLTPIEFDLLLDKHDLYDVVQDLISTNRTLKIAYNRATFFSRTDLFIEQARIALALTNEQIDGMWTS